MDKLPLNDAIARLNGSDGQPSPDAALLTPVEHNQDSTQQMLAALGLGGLCKPVETPETLEQFWNRLIENPPVDAARESLLEYAKTEHDSLVTAMLNQQQSAEWNGNVQLAAEIKRDIDRHCREFTEARAQLCDQAWRSAFTRRWQRDIQKLRREIEGLSLPQLEERCNALRSNQPSRKCPPAIRRAVIRDVVQERVDALAENLPSVDSPNQAAIVMLARELAHQCGIQTVTSPESNPPDQPAADSGNPPKSDPRDDALLEEFLDKLSPRQNKSGEIIKFLWKRRFATSWDSLPKEAFLSDSPTDEAIERALKRAKNLLDSHTQDFHRTLEITARNRRVKMINLRPDDSDR